MGWLASGGGESNGEGHFLRALVTRWLASGGGESNGEGEWFNDDSHRCELTMQTNGLQQALDAVTSLQFGAWAAGLYQNDRVPKRGDVLSQYVPATFSGYVGTKRLYGWTPAGMAGKRARSTGDRLKWMHDGGTMANWIYGYYVVDLSGKLTYAERFCDGPFLIDRAGRALQLDPAFTARNENE